LSVLVHYAPPGSPAAEALARLSRA
jgi:hypothetical protein